MNSSMGIFLNSPAPLVLAVVGVLFTSGVSLLLSGGAKGREVAAKGAFHWVSVWLPAASTFGLLVVLVLEARALSQGEAAMSQSWSLGWILPLRDAGSIALGLRVDHVSVSAGIVATLLGLLGHIFLGVERGAKSASQLSLAIGIGLSGSLICWTGINPWVSFVGLAIVAAGGLTALGADWRSENESEYLMRFGIERSGGLMLAIVGACVLPTIGFGNPKFGLLGTGAENAFSGAISESLGVILFISGVVVFMQPFPLLGRVSRVVRNQPLGSVYLAQAVSAWAALGVLIRNVEIIRSSGFEEGLGWCGLICGFLAAIPGLLQVNWMSASALWVSCVGMVSVAALGFSGVSTAFSIGLGVPLAGLAWSVLGHETQVEDGSGPSSRQTRGGNDQRASWIGSLAIGAAWAGSGALFFLGAGGWLVVLDGALEKSPLRFALLVGVATASFVLSARVAWLIGNSLLARDPRPISWGRTMIPFMALVCGVGVVWSGSLTGFGSGEVNDRVVGSLLSLFPDGVSNRSGVGRGPILIGLQSALVLLSFLFVHWGKGRSSVLWKTFSTRAPKVVGFLASGYQIDALMAAVVRTLKRVGCGIQAWVDDRVFGRWVPVVLEGGVEFLGSRVGVLDGRMTEWLARLARRLSMGFSAGVQSLQTGDLQWYITFAIGSGIALLLHFFANRS